MNHSESPSFSASDNRSEETAAEVPSQAGEPDLIDSLRSVVGQDYVLTNQEACEFYSHDVFRAGAQVQAVVQPGAVDELQAALSIAWEAGIPVIARGGGMSYTDAYLPGQSDSLMIDMRRMNRIVEINPEARYVVVEAGVTWSELDEALAGFGLRTPYWGPLSGLRATVGGTLSQGSMFLGSGQHGSVADSLLALEVACADGSLLRTGSWAGEHAKPFFRHHGPDLSGLFTGDSGALGFKVRASLRLVKRPAETRFLSFSFNSHTELLQAMANVAREEVASESFAFDPFLQGLRMQRASLREDVSALGNVMKAAGGGIRGLKEGAKLALAGRKFLDENSFSLHMTVDGRDAADADSRAAAVRRAVASLGREVEGSVPRVMRGTPFGEINSILGPSGQRWLPVHGILPLPDAQRAFEALEELFEQRRATNEAHGIEHGYLMSTISNHAFLIEPCLYWPDSRTLFHSAVLSRQYLDKLPEHAASPQARREVESLRVAIADRLHELGATCFQVGKVYPYSRNRDPGQWQLLKALKAELDGKSLVNPGALGLPAE
jgi:FAD/FMN-containing dehydrogenase